MTKIVMGTDHAGYALKEILKEHLRERGFEVADFGAFDESSVDYPDFIHPAARSVAAGESDLGIVLGGSGNGEAMAANKNSGIRCALCWSEESARLAREHNDANMISLGARLTPPDLAKRIVDSWLDAEFEGGRHAGRLAKLEPCL